MNKFRILLLLIFANFFANSFVCCGEIKKQASKPSAQDSASELTIARLQMSSEINRCHYCQDLFDGSGDICETCSQDYSFEVLYCESCSKPFLPFAEIYVVNRKLVCDSNICARSLTKS